MAHNSLSPARSPEDMHHRDTTLPVPPARSAQDLGKVEKVRDIIDLNPSPRRRQCCSAPTRRPRGRLSIAPGHGFHRPAASAKREGLCDVEGGIHDTIRNGTTTSFAAHDAAICQVSMQWKPGHRRSPNQFFLRQIEHSVPGSQSPSDRGQLRNPEAPESLCLAVVVLTVSCAWHTNGRLMAVDVVGGRPSQVERWLGSITQRSLRRGSTIGAGCGCQRSQHVRRL